MLTIERNKRDAELPRDRAPAEIPVRRDASQQPAKRAAELRGNKANREAIERGEDEGMIVGPA